MRLLHFSDVHAGGWPQALGGWFDKRLLGSANYWLRRHRRHNWTLIADMIELIPEVKPDLVVCTGDHSSISEPREFEQAMTALEPLLADGGLEMLFVPGNHDAYVKDELCGKALADVVRRMNRGTVAIDDYPLLREVGGELFLLVNQAFPQSWLSSAGEISEEASAKIEGLLQEADRPVTLLSHFPLFNADGDVPSARRHCRNNGVLVEAFREGRIKLALCGHDHHPFERRGPGNGTEICAGSLTFAGQVVVIDYADDGSFNYRWRTVCGPGKRSAEIVPIGANLANAELG